MNDILPTLDQFEKSITNSDKVRTLLLNSFQFGCNCLDESHELTESRTRDAATILVHVWERFRDEIEGPLVDVIWFATSGAPNGDNKDLNALVEIISSLLKVPGRDSFQKDLLATLDPLILQKCGLLPDPKLLTKKISKLNTELYYKQQKYNLLQEESEGYTKLLTVLFGDLIDVTPTKMREYMGNFDLDPNRVLDILFDLLDDHDQKEQILILMKDFAVDKIPLLLSFKIRQHQQNFGPSLPPSILRTSTLLAKHKILDLSTLVPSASAEVMASFAHYEELEKLRVSRLGRISLTSDSNHHSDAKFKECQCLLKESTQALESGSVLVQLLSLLLAKDDWKLASTLLPSREDWSRLCSILPNKIGTALCNHLEEQIAKQYKDLVQNPIFKSSEVSNDRTMELHNGADCIDFYADVEGYLELSLSALYAVGQSGCLSSHPNLYSKLCNLLRALLLKTNVEKLTTAVYDTLKYALVPTLSLIPPDAAISEDLWSVLSLLPFSTRYELYRDWRSGGLELSGIGSKPLIQIQYEIKAGKAARYSLKRLSKDNVRDMGRQVSKETHSNPLVVFSTILSQIESYDNLIQMMVEAVRFVTPLSLDVLGYCILTRLSGVGGVNRNRLKGTKISLKILRDPRSFPILAASPSDS
jgi:THO complex subunit 2